MRTFITTALRDAVAQMLRDNLEIRKTGAEIITRERGQLPSQIAEKLASVQLAIVVLPAVVVEANPNQSPLYYDKVSLTIRVVETVLNASGLEAEEIAELLHAYLQTRQLPAEFGNVVLFSDASPMEPGEVDAAYFIDCRFNAHGLAPFQN